VKFDEFNFRPELNEALDYMGFKEATPIQEKAIPIVLKGKDLIGVAQTGTGKTAAFLLPVINGLTDPDPKGVQCLIISPTRELAVQIEQQIQGMAYFASISSIAIYGGGDGIEFAKEKQALSKGVHIAVATPGRLISHINMGYVNTKNLKYLVLDEADRMLDMGFYDDIMKIIKGCPEKRQTLLFSATMPPKIRKLASSILKDPEEVTIAISKPAEGVLQAAYLVYDKDKIQLIQYLIQGKTDTYQSIIIFGSTKKSVKDIVRGLKQVGINAAGISSDLEQKEREDVLNRFKARKIRALVATDVISRGIDIKEVNLVINYEVPQDAEDYVHRVGRTARADSTGVALTLINDQDQQKFARIEALIEKEIMKPPLPKEIGEGPEYNPNKRRGGGNRRSGKSQKPKGRGNRKNR
jgi:superfamily II DNA/RNA helicase